MDILLLPRVWQERWVWDVVYRRARYSPELIAAFQATLAACLDEAGRDPEIRVGEIGPRAGAVPADRFDGTVCVLDDYGRVVPPGAVGWLHAQVGDVASEEAASGVTRRSGLAGSAGVSVNIGIQGRVTYDGTVEVLRGEELTP
jgi:hypothetical protein